MKRYLKILGLTAVAALAISAVGASAANALEFTANEYPAEVHAESEVGAEVFTTEAGSVECAGTFSGSASEASESFEVHPVYSSCKAFGFLEATVKTEECNYGFTPTEEVAEHEYTLTVDVLCPTGQSIKITAASCAAEVGSQSELPHLMLDVKTTPINDLKLTITVSGIHYTVTKDGLFCPFNGTGTKEGGEYNGEPLELSTEQDIHVG